MDTIRDYVRTALNGVRQRFNKLEKDLDKKLDDKLGRDELPPPQPQIQSDWNESNEESVAYVCNRPFYDDIVVKTYTYENVGQSGQTSLIIDADFEGNFILGETYTVTVNGTATDIVATTNQVGDPALFYNSSTYNRIFVSSGRLCAFTWWNSGSTVSITGPIHVLKQIDSKFLNVVSSLNGETGDVVINADKLGAASSMSNRYEIDGRHTALGESSTGVTRNWLGLGSDNRTGLVLGNVIAYDYIEDGLSVARLTFIPDLEEQFHYDNEDVVIRGVADPTALNDATSKSYVDKAINNIGKGFASVEYVNKKLNDAIPVPATATVGQTIAVKSVDENGKPTAWEPMDFISENYGGNVDQTFETVLALDEVRIGRYAKGVLESTYNRAICTRGYIKPFVVSATLTSADYQFAVAVYNNGAYVRTDGWLASGTVYTFDHDAYQYKMYIGRLDGEYVQDFDGCRQSVKLTISTADILKSYNALEIQSDTERRNTRNAVEYMMRRNYDISYANAPAPIGLTTYVGNNQIVHPKVLYFPNKFGGYMYWMAYTPYPFANEVYENPCVAYSNDGYNWVNVDGNPLDDPGGDGYNSDTHLVYVESTGTLELWYRYVSNYETTPVSEIIYRQTTNDGINWTEKEIVINNDSGDYVQYLSPAVIHDGGKYKVWAVNSTANTISYYDNGVPTPEETIALDDSMTVGKITQIGKVDETDTNYMHTEKIKLNATKSFRLTGVNLNGNTMHPALRYVTAYDADGNVLADYSLQSIAEVGGGLDRVITVDDSVDSVIISIYKAQNYTNKTITLPAVESDGELTKVRDITLNYQDGEKVYKPWHIDVIEDNGKTVLLVMCKCGTTWSLFLATSEDNETFTTPELVMVGNPYGWDTRLYRSCIVNVDGEYRIYYSAQDEIQKYGLGVSTSNTLSNFVGKW